MIAKNLDLLGVVKPYSLERSHNSYALVMEDFGGISLRDYTEKNTLELGEFLAIAIQLADILNGLYQHRVIHKDIKPANIVIHPKTKQVKLIDFSIASLLPRETQEIKNPQVLEGTLAYISPEQTGRMNRGIDYRSDFYSLGVTFFELLTGQLPFHSNDPMELIHCHIAKMPQGIGNNEEIPQLISDIVMKLMAKNAEDRYQSALGLKFDLQNCLEQLKTIQTRLSEDEQQVIIRIADNGTGMTEEVKQKIFDYLFTTKPVGQGTGLGLAIAHQIVVERHHGTLKVDSVLGQGTEFAIALPIVVSS